MESELRCLPSVERLVSDQRFGQLLKVIPRAALVNLVRQRLERDRQAIMLGKPCPSIDEMIESVQDQAQALANPSLLNVINATGVILHTNLGRASLSQEAVLAMDLIAKSYSNLEFDLSSGRRSSRQVHVEQILCWLSGAEAAVVVNNNASAVLLALTALAKKREVIVSRGQAVEIGGGFRIPDVMRQSGAKLVEVGTTNCTYASDYEQAINQRTAALLRVHSSNFKVIGFTSSVSLEELAVLGDRYHLPVFDDLGSGCFLDTTRFGLGQEPMVQQSIALGASLVFFSGDKLVGGPQAGIIVGKKHFIDKLKKHPLARAVRIDKIRLAGLLATLIHYLNDEAAEKIPTWRMISASLEELDRRARLWAEAVDGIATVVPGESVVGGGSLPGGTLPTRLVALGKEGENKVQHTPQLLAQRLRAYKPPIIGRISGNILFLDPRSVLPEEDVVILQALHDLVVILKHSQPQ